MIRYILAALFLLSLGCSTSETETTDPAWGHNMRGTAGFFYQLVPYLYNQQKFEDPKNREKLRKNITGFRQRIHKIKPDFAEKILGDDPYVVKSLSHLKNYSRRAEKSFERGDLGTARLLLKTTADTCFKCHTRQNLGQKNMRWKPFPIETFGIRPVDKAQIQISLRQFEGAKNTLTEFLNDRELESRFDIEYENALHYFIMISLRGESGIDESLKFVRFKRLAIDGPDHLEQSFLKWEKDLLKWRKRKVTPSLETAKKLLATTLQNESERHLIDDLLVSQMLHQILPVLKTKSQKAEAYLMLGQVYDRLILAGFWDLPENYYETCIDYSPKTKLSKTCFDRLKNNITLGYSGSRGTLIPDQEYKRMDRLRVKAGY